MSGLQMSLRERWALNRQRRAEGLREVDAMGREIVPRISVPLTEAELQSLSDRTMDSYDPSSPNYRRYQGD